MLQVGSSVDWPQQQLGASTMVEFITPIQIYKDPTSLQVWASTIDAPETWAFLPLGDPCLPPDGPISCLQPLRIFVCPGSLNLCVHDAADENVWSYLLNPQGMIADGYLIQARARRKSASSHFCSATPPDLAVLHAVIAYLPE